MNNIDYYYYVTRYSDASEGVLIYLQHVNSLFSKQEKWVTVKMDDWVRTSPKQQDDFGGFW